jgi:hypothetical protein
MYRPVSPLAKYPIHPVMVPLIVCYWHSFGAGKRIRREVINTRSGPTLYEVRFATQGAQWRHPLDRRGPSENPTQQVNHR